MSTYIIIDYNIFTYTKQLPVMPNDKYLLPKYDYLEWQK